MVVMTSNRKLDENSIHVHFTNLDAGAPKLAFL